MTKRRLMKMLQLGARHFSDPYYQGFAAQVAFFFMLSLVPTLLLISQILFGILGSTLEDAVGWIFRNAPGSLAETFKTLLEYRSAGLTNVIYVFIAFWAASRAQFALTRINNYMNSEGWSTGRGYWPERFRSVVNMFFTLLVIIAGLAIMANGGRVFEYLPVDPKIWQTLRWPIAFILFFFMISFNYYRMPEGKVKYRETIPGSIFASIGLLIVTLVYDLLTSYILNYDIIYGSLSAIVIILFWFYFMAWVLFLGMLFNKVWKDTKNLK